MKCRGVCDISDSESHSLARDAQTAKSGVIGPFRLQRESTSLLETSSQFFEAEVRKLRGEPAHGPQMFSEGVSDMNLPFQVAKYSLLQLVLPWCHQQLLGKRLVPRSKTNFVIFKPANPYPYT